MGGLGHSERRWAQRALPLLPILRARHGQVRADLADRQRLGACNRLPCDRAACDSGRTQHRAHLRDPLNAMDDLMSRRVQATALVEAVIKRITDGYISRDGSARAASLLRARCEAGASDLPAGLDLCERLSADLFEACADKHLRLLWHESAEASRDEAALEAELLEQFRRENYGMRRVQQLPGSIGVIELTVIPPVSTAGPTIAPA